MEGGGKRKRVKGMLMGSEKGKVGREGEVEGGERRGVKGILRWREKG